MRVMAPDLQRLVSAIVRAAGGDEREAELVAHHLVAANLAGHDSHGVGMLPLYVEHVRSGRLKPGQHATVAQDSGAILVLDGHAGFGHVVAQEATEMGLARARELGYVFVALRNAHHIGRIGGWGELCAEAGFISIHYVNAIGHRPLVAPHGGSDARYTTNPYCTAIPATTKTPAMVLDMATSQIALGKVRVAFNKGEKLPEPWLIDESGRKTDDPGIMFPDRLGALLPMGEHKGYGLALVCDILSGALSGGGTFLPERLARESIVNNMLMIIIDPARFGNLGEIQSEIDAFTAWVKASPPREGFDEVLVPGDPERRMRALRGAQGIPIDPTTWEQLLAAGESVGLARKEAEALAPSQGDD